MERKRVIRVLGTVKKPLDKSLMKKVMDLMKKFNKQK